MSCCPRAWREQGRVRSGGPERARHTGDNSPAVVHLEVFSTEEPAMLPQRPTHVSLCVVVVLAAGGGVWAEPVDIPGGGVRVPELGGSVHFAASASRYI
jgi:hypothetical protein